MDHQQRALPGPMWFVLPQSSGYGADDLEGSSDYPACGQRAGGGTHPSEGAIKRHLHFL